MDCRSEEHILCDGRELNVLPDVIGDFRKMPFLDSTFKLVIFDPPHLKQLGKTSWMAKKYGVLSENWKNDIRKGFSECMRVLEEGGVLIFKWNEHQILISDILKLVDQPPLIGHRSGKLSKTHWLTFMKLPNENNFSS